MRKVEVEMRYVIGSQRHQWIEYERGSNTDALKEMSAPAKDVKSVASHAQASL